MTVIVFAVFAAGIVAAFFGALWYLERRERNAIDAAYWNVLGRAPSPDESNYLYQFLYFGHMDSSEIPQLLRTTPEAITSHE